MHGSPSRISAIVTDASGAEPSTTDARDAPASRIDERHEAAARSRAASARRAGTATRAARARRAQALPRPSRRRATANAPITVATVASSTSGYRFRPMRRPDAHRAEEERRQAGEADRRQRSARSAAASQRRRMSAENGPTANQYARNARRELASIAADARLGREQRPVPAAAAEISTTSRTWPRPCRVERREPRARRPRATGGAEDDARRLLDERLQARSSGARPAPSRRPTGREPVERAHERVRRHRDPERSRDGVLGPSRDRALVALARVVDRQELVEARHPRDATYTAAHGHRHARRRSPPSSPRTPPSGSSATSASTRSPTRTPSRTRSTAKQLDLLRLLADELKRARPRRRRRSTTTATSRRRCRRPSTHESPTIALLRARRHGARGQRRERQPAALPLRRRRHPARRRRARRSARASRRELANHVGHELITTDGTTLLGADDKAGIAEIMAAVAYLAAHPEIPHGTVKVAFNPRRGGRARRHPLPDRHVRRRRRVHRRRLDRRRGAERDVLGRAGADARSTAARSIPAGRRARW